MFEPGPNYGEDILKYKPECLGPTYQKQWFRALARESGYLLASAELLHQHNHIEQRLNELEEYVKRLGSAFTRRRRGYSSLGPVLPLERS